MNATKKPSTPLRMTLMLIIVAVIFGAIFTFQYVLKPMFIKKFLEANAAQPMTVSAQKVDYAQWQPALKAVGSLRASRGVSVTTELAGIVKSVDFASGNEVKAGQLLVQLNIDADTAQLEALRAAADLAQTVYERDKAQYAVQAIAKATLDADAADLRAKKAQVAQQAAIVNKKTIRAPFAGKAGITTVNPGQYLNPGDKIVTLQALDTLYVDFYLPQQNVAQLAVGQNVSLTSDAHPDVIYRGKITAIDPLIDTATRNVMVEATIKNPKHELLPGMFAVARVETGAPQRYLTLPQTAISFNPYGATVYVVQDVAASDGKTLHTVTQKFVKTGDTRGDQVAVLDGLNAGDLVVTSGQLKLSNGSAVVINNAVLPSNAIAPHPRDE